MSNEVTQLIRRGGKLLDATRERTVSVLPASKGVLVPTFLARQTFVVPKRHFLVPHDIDGKPIEARIQETGERVTIYPELRLLGVISDEGGELLAASLAAHYERQIPAVRDLTDGIFRSFLGNNPPASALEAIAIPGKESYPRLRDLVASEIGLLIDWTLQPAPRVAAWLEKLIHATPASRVVKYNHERAETEFKLSFSMSIERASLSNLHRLQRRYALGLRVEEELERVFQRVYERTIPAFRTVWTGLTSWNIELVRELAVDGFAKVVADKLSREFGYQVRFSDFTPEPNAFALATAALVSPHELLQRQFEDAKEIVADLRAKRLQTLKDTEGNYERVKGIDQNLAQAEGELKTARDKALAGSQEVVDMLGAMQPPALEELRQKFRSALLLESESESTPPA